ncbi:hypothetical protein AB6805_11175 [Chitinophaga sp. RCC_12]|uniref:hypothetical protein n=1 Tax=Chitinophaga sp. RCC_12 TaxID=3239226 RepID=UPI0035256078
MKKIFLFAVLLMALQIQAQTVKIPDANFKAALINQGFDTNNDGEIQVAEAQKVTRLYVNGAGIANLTGIKSFTNLKEFGFYDNQIKTLDLEGMASLRSIYGADNNMEYARVKGLTNLETMYLNDNKIRALDLTGLNKLNDLKMYRNALFKVNFSHLPNLENVELQYNSLVEFVAEGSGVKKLNLNNNNISSIDLTSLKKLEKVDLDDNMFLSTLKIRGLRSLRSLYCSPNLIKNLNMSGTVSLTELSW